MEAVFSAEAFEFASQLRIKDLMTIYFVVHFRFFLLKLFVEKITIVLVQLRPFLDLLFARFRILF